MSVRNVIFDFGGVLLRWKPQEIVASIYSDPEFQVLVQRQVFQHPDWLELDRGSLEESLAVSRFAERVGRSQSEMKELMDAARASLHPLEDSIALLRELHARNVPLYGLSNISAPNFAYLRGRYDHWNLFRGIVISGEIGLIKPDPEIFAHICAKYALRPAETVFIDDHAPNIEAARRIGFAGILFENAQQCRSELRALISDPARDPSPP